jgi:hypothetical protein
LIETDLYPAIFKRKSIRKYDLTPLSDEALARISRFLQGLDRMDEGIKTELKIVSTGQVKRRIMKAAPHYVAAFSEVEHGYLSNIGFMLQQADLFFSAGDLGSCWQAIPKPTEDVLLSSNLEFVILMAFGNAKEPLHRTSVSEFKRKSLPEITDIKGVDELLEAVRLAPTPSNSPYFFTGDEDLIHVYLKPSLIRSLVAKKLLYVEVGIAICHLYVAAKHFGKKAKVEFDEKADMEPPRNLEYIASLNIESSG